MTTQPTVRKTLVSHGITSTGRQRAIDIAAEIDRIKREATAAGARDVFVVFGKEEGTLLVCEQIA